MFKSNEESTESSKTLEGCKMVEDVSVKAFDIYKIIIYSSQNVIPGYICKKVYIHKNVCSTLLFLFEIPSKKKTIGKYLG